MENETQSNTVVLSCSVSPQVKTYLEQRAKDETAKNGYKVKISNIVNKILIKDMREYNEKQKENNNL